MNELTTQQSAPLAANPMRAGLTPRTLDEAFRLADMLASSSIVPKDYINSPGNILVAIQWGAEIGLPPLQAMQNLAVVNGRPSLWGDAVIALVRGSGLLASIEETWTETSCTCTVQRKGEAPTSRTFSMEDAKRAGLAGKQGPWSQYPKRMMQMRARAWAMRDVFPDVLRGVQIAEEVQDMPTAAPQMVSEQPAPAIAPPVAVSRADKARAAVAARRAQAEPVSEPAAGPALDEVLGAIHAATTVQALQAGAELAKGLTDPAERAAARDAYAGAKARLTAIAHDVQPSGAQLVQEVVAVTTGGDSVSVY